MFLKTMRSKTYIPHSDLEQKRQNITTVTLSTLSFIAIMTWRDKGWDYFQIGVLVLLLSWFIFVWFDWFKYRANNGLSRKNLLLDVASSMFQDISNNHFFIDVVLIFPSFFILGFLYRGLYGFTVGLILGFINIVASYIAEKYPLYH
jgi:hypothetical protein